jgi:hypothetical protein
MKRLSLTAAISGSILVGMTINGAYGQCVSHPVPLKNQSGDYIHYFLTRDAPGNQSKMGELFFATQESDNRVELGKYNGSCWTKIVSWVEKKYLIEGLRPLTVGQAVKQFPPLAQEPGVKPGSTLWLRALQKPEYHKHKPLPAPDPNQTAKKEVGLEGLAYRWRHVYAIESNSSGLWYLVGSRSKLFNDPRTDTNISLSNDDLLGWVPAKANQLLATNIGLEPNTTQAAVDERIHQNRPIILYQTKSTSSKPISKEALEVWDDYKKGQRTAGTQAWIEPYGLAPNYPRFYIHGFERNTGWYHVSTWGSVGDKLKPSDITRLAGQLQDTLDRLRKVDIVVVFDRTGSMDGELNALTEWLKTFAKDLARIQAGKTTGLQFLGKDEQFTTGLEIYLSLVLYEEKQDYPIFKRVKLSSGISQVINGINSITLQGGYETMFDTLTRVVPSNSGYWQPGGFSQRYILLITDEPGDVGDKGEADVARALPLPVKELQEMGYDLNKMPKKEWTKIWGVYTSSNVSAFQRNVDQFIDGKRLKHIADFKSSTNKTGRFKTEMIQVIQELQQEIVKRAKALSTMLVQEHQTQQQSGQAKPSVSATMKLQQAAIQAALKDAGTNLEELSAMVGVAFVEGYIPLKDQGRQHSTIQEVVVLEDNELRTLRNNVHSIGEEIERTFQPSALSGGALGAIMQKLSGSNRQEKVAASLLYAILAAAGDTATLNYFADMDPIQFAELIRGWLRENAQNNIAGMMGMQTSIETGSEGLLNRPIQEIVNMPDNTIRDEARLMLNKSHCLGKILDGRTIPLKVSDCPAHQGIQKRWKYEQGSENYIYVPMRVIP